MPGTPEEYAASGDYSRASDLLTEAVAAGETDGIALLTALEGAGLRVYSEGAVSAEETAGEEMPEEMEEGAVEEGFPLDEDLAAMGEGESMAGPAGGRGDIMEAVRFGMEEDKKNKTRRQEEMSGY